MLLLILTGVWGYNQYQEKQRVEHYLGNRFRQAYFKMVENVEDIEVLLGKAMVSVSPRHNIISLTNIWQKAMDAQEQLTNLPLSVDEIHRTARYLSQTGDYAHTIARKNAEGRVMTEEEREQLAELRLQAEELNRVLHELELEVLEGNVSWHQIVKGTRERAGDVAEGKFRDGLVGIQQDLNQYPTLIYNGPFSDHVARIEPRGITGEEISISEAEEKVEEILDIYNGDNLEIVDSGSTDGRIEAYNFNVNLSTEDQYSIDISKKGGQLVNMIGSRPVDTSQYDLEEARDKAQKYLAAVGYAGMEATYGEKEDNTAYLSFVYEDDDILYYPDMIKVRIALDNNQVTSLEAQNYLSFHRERELEEPVIEEEEVESMVSERLTEIEDIRLALIPQDSLEEVLCYQVRGSFGEEEYLVYINAINGNEEEILRLVTTSEGTFTI